MDKNIEKDITTDERAVRFTIYNTNGPHFSDHRSNAVLVELMSLKCGIRTQTVHFDDFLKSINNKKYIIKTPVLPLNTLRYVEKDNKVFVFMYFDPCIKEIMFHKNSNNEDRKAYYNVPVPPSIWAVELKNKEGNDNKFDVVGTYIHALSNNVDILLNDVKLSDAAVKRQYVDPERFLYHWPFPNHSTNRSLMDGQGVCWNVNANVNKDPFYGNGCELSELYQIFDIYFSTCFNNDLSGTFEGEGLGNIFQLMEGKTLDDMNKAVVRLNDLNRISDLLGVN